MKLSVVNKSTILNRFVRYTLQRKITHLAEITRKTNIKLGILKGGTGKELNCRFVHLVKFHCIVTTLNRLFKVEFERGDWKRDSFLSKCYFVNNFSVKLSCKKSYS